MVWQFNYASTDFIIAPFGVILQTASLRKSGCVSCIATAVSQSGNACSEPLANTKFDRPKE